MESITHNSSGLSYIQAVGSSNDTGRCRKKILGRPRICECLNAAAAAVSSRSTAAVCFKLRSSGAAVGGGRISNSGFSDSSGSNAAGGGEAELLSAGSEEVGKSGGIANNGGETEDVVEIRGNDCPLPMEKPSCSKMSKAGSGGLSFKMVGRPRFADVGKTGDDMQLL